MSILVVIPLWMTSCYSYGPIHEPYYRSSASKSIHQESLNDLTSDHTKVFPEPGKTDIEVAIKDLFPENILFRPSEIEPCYDYTEQIHRLCALLKQQSDLSVMITGHCDLNASPELKRKTSQQRAELIKDMLVSQGIKSTRLTVWGLGDSSPIADNSTEQGRSYNRRVEFVVLHDLN